MSTKRNNSEKIDLVRKILDNPNDISLSTKDKYIDSLRTRLKKKIGHHVIKNDYAKTKETSLTPSVEIHHVYPDKQPSTIPEQPGDRSRFTQAEIYPKDYNFFNEGEDLFEIEHVSEINLPSFIEVKTKDQLPVTKIEKISPLTFDKQESTDQLPEWELAEDESTFDVQSDSKKPGKTAIKKEIPIWKSVSDETIVQEKSPKRKPFFKRISHEKNRTDKKKIESKFILIDSKESIKKPDQRKSKKFYQYKGYILYQKEIDLGNNIKRVIHFFSKDKPDDSVPSNLPKNYEVKINKNTGVPYIRKKQN
jgi:hypothetical protein